MNKKMPDTKNNQPTKKNNSIDPKPAPKKPGTTTQKQIPKTKK